MKFWRGAAVLGALLMSASSFGPIEVAAAQARVTNPRACLVSCTRQYQRCRATHSLRMARRVCPPQRSACNTNCLRPPL
jgi:hypothetical protein